MNVHIDTIPGGVSRSWIFQQVSRNFRAGAEGLAADSAARLSPAAIATRGFVRRQVAEAKGSGRLAADSAGAVGTRMVAGLAAAGIGPARELAADAQFYSRSLETSYGAVITRPRQETEIIDTIPVRSVSPGAETYRIRTRESSGKPAIYQGPGTEIPTVQTTRAERVGQLHALVIKTDGPDWLQALHESYSGESDAQADAEAAVYALRQALEQGLLSGLAGLNFKSLTGPQQILCERYDSVLVYGTDTADDLIADMVRATYLQSERSNGLFKPDSLLISERLLNRLAGYTNFTAGATDTALRVVQARLSEVGIRNIVPGYRLANAGGASVDGALFYRASDDRAGLRHVLGMDAAPVWTYQGPSGTSTVYAIISGGLESVDAGTTLFYTAEVTA